VDTGPWGFQASSAGSAEEALWAPNRHSFVASMSWKRGPSGLGLTALCSPCMGHWLGLAALFPLSANEKLESSAHSELSHLCYRPLIQYPQAGLSAAAGGTGKAAAGNQSESTACDTRLKCVGVVAIVIVGRHVEPCLAQTHGTAGEECVDNVACTCRTSSCTTVRNCTTTVRGSMLQRRNNNFQQIVSARISRRALGLPGC